MAREVVTRESTAVEPGLAPSEQNVEWIPTEDFQEIYANILVSEPAVWDLRIRLGTLDQSVQPIKVNYHTALNIPWAQAKLAAFYLRVVLAAHEAQNGKIPIPASVRPRDPAGANLPQEMSPDLLQRLQRIYAEFVESI